MPDNTEIITRFEMAYRGSDLKTIEELCDPDLIDHTPVPGYEPNLTGFLQKIRDLAPIFQFKEDLQDIAATGDTVATRWVVTGTQLKEFMGTPPNGNPIRVEGMNFYHLKNGRVAEIWGQFDHGALADQIGLTSPATSGTA